MMKKIKIKNIMLFLSLLMLAGCDFMDCDESDNFSKQEVLDSYSRVKQLATNVYGFLKADFCSIDGAMLDAATDDAVHVYKSSNIQRFVDGTWSANNLVDNVWGHYYEGIRAANFYLAETVGLTFDEWKYADDYEDIIKEFTNYQYEVRFLRAYFYFELIKRYRNVPLVLNVLTQDEANNVSPESYEKIAKFIVDECSELALILPVNYDGFKSKEKGRITRTAAMALKSRVTLYMASPLFSEHDEEEKWRQAAEAAYDIIRQNTDLGVKLVNYPQLFNAENNQREEVILYRPTGENGDFEKANFPIGVVGGKTSTCPTQNLMEAYDMKNGTPFDWEKNKSNPYKNRDPRMDNTIVYNQMTWLKKTMQIWEGGANGLPLQNATTTGYYLRKYVNFNVSFGAGSTVTKMQHNWVLFRYGEILLNYAEAMINAFHDPNYKDAVFDMSAREAVNKIRTRTNVALPALPSTITEQEFVKRLKNERRVELAFEGHRFWDVRRWKELDQTANIYGVKITKENGKFNYEKILLETRVVTDNMYFYPIPNAERFKNPKLGQNPGW